MKIHLNPHEMIFEVTRSRGPGGQNVNRTNSGVILRWSPYATSSFTSEQKDRLIAKLKDQLSLAGELVIRADEFRSQDMNKNRCIEKLFAKIQGALHIPKPRKKTKPTYSSVQKRHTTKKKRSETKKLRKRVEYE